MLSFLFWNLNGDNPSAQAGALQKRIGSLAMHFGIDVFIFVESNFTPTLFADWLSGLKVGRYWHSASVTRRIQVFTRLPRNSVHAQHDSVDERLTIRRVLAGPHELLLAAVHLRSLLHQREASAGFQATVVHTDIATVERSLNNYHTVVVGDLNMNPFSEGLVAAQAFHGVMTTGVAQGKDRIVEGRTYRYFYNPMWSFFGDRSPGPPGTFYYSASSSLEYHWHMFDQVLLRPELMHSLEELLIVDNDGDVSLLNQNGRPDVLTASDHLPILFRLRLESQD